MAIRIITDGAADLTNEEAAKFNVIKIDTPVCFKGSGERPRTREEFWRKLKAGEVAITSQIPPDGFWEEFKKAQSAKDNAVCIVISSQMSATYKNASLVKLDGKFSSVSVIDSKMASVAQKFLVMRACSLREKGLSYEDISLDIENFKKRIRLLACMDTLKYAARGGRVSSSAAAIGTLINIKPIITFSAEGKIKVLARPTGKKRGGTRLIELLEADKFDEKFPLAPIYSDSALCCDELIKKLSDKGIKCAEPTPIGEVIGAHIGPAAFGLVYVKKETD